MRRAANAVVVALLALALPTIARAGCQVESLELPVKMVGSRAVATVGINGTPVPMTVDSGAFFSILTDAAAEELKLTLRRDPRLRVEGLTGKVDVHTTIVDKLSLLRGDIDKVQFVVGGNDPGAGTMGLIGRNILSFTDAEYDLAHGVIRLLFPNNDCGKANMAYWAGSSPVTEIDLMSNDHNELPEIRAWARLNGIDVTAVFDTGATTVVSARAATRAGVAEADLKPAGSIHGAGAGRADSWTANFDKFELGGEVIRNNRLHVAEFHGWDADMLLGIDFFLSHRIYVSKKQSKMFFTYNGGPVFALDRSDGASPSLEADAAQPATADAFARRGAASAARLDYESALADLDKSCELEPTVAAFFAQRGAIHAVMSHPAKAQEDFDKALQLDPTDAEARFDRAALRMAAKDRDGAKADLAILDEALPPRAQMRRPMASLYLELGEPVQSIAHLNQWLSAHPKEATRDSALNSRCWSRVMLGAELDQALDDCNNAVDSDPKNSAFLDSRGWVYLRMGRYDKALSDFDRSLEYQHESASSLYGRGLAKTRLGDAAQGSADLAAARKVKPDVDLSVPHTGLMAEPAPKL